MIYIPGDWIKDGKNEDEIRRFLPKEIRVNQLKQIKNMVK